MGIDFERIAATAVESFIGGEPASDGRQEGSHRRLSGAKAIALGVGLTIAARVAYSRARTIDLERLAGAVEHKLSD